MTYDHGVDTAYMDRIRQRVQDLFCPHPADHALAEAVRKATYWRCPRHKDRMAPVMDCTICVDVVLRVYRAALEDKP